jgi:hypothetical protein
MASRSFDIGSTASRFDNVPTRSGLRESEADASNAHHPHNGPSSSSSGPRPSGTGSDSRKRISASSDVHEDESRTKQVRAGAKTKDRTAQRASQACLRCRRQKLRCLGGNPCERCVRTSNECDFGNTGYRTNQITGDVNISETVPTGAEDPIPANDQGRGERLKLLETSVANLLAGLAEEPDLNGQGYPHLEIFHEVVKHRKEPSRSAPSMASTSSTRLPPPTHVRPLDPIRIGTAPVNPVISPSSIHQGHHSMSPAILFDTSPNESSYKAPQSLDAAMSHATATRPDNGGGMPSPATQSLYEPPFRSLVRPVSPLVSQMKLTS